MATVYSMLLDLCGLSLREAAGFHRVHLDTVKSWSAGRNKAPDRVLDDLATLSADIDKAAEKTMSQVTDLVAWRGEIPGVMDLGLCSDDAEAQSIGWPCVGAQRACLGRVIAMGRLKGYGFRVVPRGTTSASAAAADALDHFLSSHSRPNKSTSS